MIRPMFAIKDRRAQMFAQPFPHHNKGTAMRAVTDELRNAQNPMRLSASDYELYEIGSYNDETGELSSGDVVLVCVLNDIIPQG